LLRGRRRVVLRASSTRYTDRRVESGRRYRYRVRPCRHHRCARWTPAKAVTVPPAGTRPTLAPGPAGGGSSTPPVGGSRGVGGASTPDAFAGSPTNGGCPVLPK